MNKPVVNPWLVAAAVVIPTFMEVLDTTIANVALRYIAGGLNAAASDAEWVITSYLAANAAILPVSGWLSTRLGRRNYFLISIALFTLASALCGVASSLEALILFRILQGLAGGGLQPSTQGILLDSFPPEKQGAAMGVFGIAALVAPILGPTLGGWITDNASWRWIFYINVPVGLFGLFATWALVTDPDYLVDARAKAVAARKPFDALGMGLLVLVMSAWEIFLSKGQEWDWFGDPEHRIHLLFAAFTVGVVALVWWERRAPDPVIDFSPLAERNFRIASLFAFCVFGALYGATTLIPAMLQSLFGYSALNSGLVLSPSGFFSVSLMPVVAGLLGRGVDARRLIAMGLLVMGAGFFRIARLDLTAGPGDFVVARIVQIVGLSLIFAPLTVAAYMYLPHRQRGAATGLYSLLRNEGGSVGVSLAKTLTDRRDQFHALRLGENLDPLNPAVTAFTDQTAAQFRQLVGDPVAAQQMAIGALDAQRHAQSLTLAFLDSFFALGVLTVLLLVPLAFMRRAVAAKGEHLVAE